MLPPRSLCTCVLVSPGTCRDGPAFLPELLSNEVSEFEKLRSRSDRPGVRGVTLEENRLGQFCVVQAFGRHTTLLQLLIRFFRDIGLLGSIPSLTTLLYTLSPRVSNRLGPQAHGSRMTMSTARAGRFFVSYRLIRFVGCWMIFPPSHLCRVDTGRSSQSTSSSTLPVATRRHGRAEKFTMLALVATRTDLRI
ncbi:hypothetical protein HG531_008610 [Fusarium graminearum]|nr:hypothetical protein HG531_008610 [Fusarium graminearum]